MAGTNGLSAELSANGPLFDYVAKEDPTYGWVKRRQGTLARTIYVDLTLTSQTWRGVAWKHQLFILKPFTIAPDVRQALLFIDGGSWKDGYEHQTDTTELPEKIDLLATIAEQTRTPTVLLRQVPHQPLFERSEDEIIAYTFENYLNTGDPEWPVLLPMVKSAVRAMDTTAEFAEREWNMHITSFTVTGASKRGWTTWLTGAIDTRVTAIAPMVFDILNMESQLAHQQFRWGTLSNEISEYTERGLHRSLDTEAGRALTSIVDPYQYRHLLNQTKLIILGTNDPYWPLDALNLYWNKLIGQKYVLYLPNNRHKLWDYQRIAGSLSTLHQHAVDGRRLPELSWKFKQNADSLTMDIVSDLSVNEVSAWVALSPTSDFRHAHWTSHTLGSVANTFSFELSIPNKGFAALFGEAKFEPASSFPLFLSTNVRIVGNAEPTTDVGHEGNASSIPSR